MEMNELIAKINYYSRLSRERELTEEEKKDRQKYRQIYIEIFKKQVKSHLDNIEIVN